MTGGQYINTASKKHTTLDLIKIRIAKRSIWKSGFWLVKSGWLREVNLGDSYSDKSISVIGGKIRIAFLLQI